ncbi:hypothetical protein P7K49_014774 [Saguinus oedipus]|uniref:Uncharacterized protein n=1 Tax=Saguinus oedipus TaxID=9490 RepID=A0ABQ9V7E8_SAGOE|nr:hypothetical protein P7K49_014774 [Saguinus oedipus]
MRVPVTEDVKDETEEEKTGEEENEENQVFYKPVIEDLSMELARKCTELISDYGGLLLGNDIIAAAFPVIEKDDDGRQSVKGLCNISPFKPEMLEAGKISTKIHYKEEFKKSKDKCTFVTDTPMLNHVKNIGAFISEAKYKGTIKADLSNSLYKRMPATIDSVFAREVTQLQSKVAYKQKHDAAKGFSDYAHMKEPPEVKHAMEVNKHQSNHFRSFLDLMLKLMVPKSRITEELEERASGINGPQKDHSQTRARLSEGHIDKGISGLEASQCYQDYSSLRTSGLWAVYSTFRQDEIDLPTFVDEKDVQDTHTYNAELNRPDIKMATQISKIISNAEYKKGQGMMNKEPAVIGRPDFEHAIEASKLSRKVNAVTLGRKAWLTSGEHPRGQLGCGSDALSQGVGAFFMSICCTVLPS